ncbi:MULTISPECIES: hypothetical protein [Aeromonas]|uniref:hypothetical protein n=1 Tax=Aeromonas sanarellii TaxID=633415 RepID=UPI00398908FE
MSFLSKLKFLHKQTTPFISGPVLLPFTSKISTQSSKKKKTTRLAYSENDIFYSKLDDALTERCKISIYFKDEKLSENSKLFKYMSHCDGWPQVKSDLLTISKNHQKASMIMTPSCTAAISAGVIYAIIIAISAVFVFALCKDYNIKFKAKPKDFEFEFDIKKPQPNF